MIVVDSDGAVIRVGEMARRVGLSARTIKYYEERGLLCPTRSENRYRLYSEADVERLERIRELRGFGLSVATIEEVLRHPTQRDDDGAPHLPLAVAEQIYQSLHDQRCALLARIEQGRQELAQVETVARELENDLGYLRGHLEARRAQEASDPGSLPS
jgi:MerR family transcriptional regulator, repressor of the yfmOP operon